MQAIAARKAHPESRVSAAAPLVLHVIHNLAIGGLENGLVNLINRMPEARFRHAIACIEDYSDFINRISRPDVEVIALHRSKIGVWPLRRRLFDVCRRLRPAIVHSRNISGLDAVFPAYLAGVRAYIHGEHGWDVDDLDGKNWKPAMLRRAHAPFIDRYITVSKHLERYLVERVGVSHSRITQIYNGVDTGRFRPAATRTVSLPADFAANDSVIFGTVGRICEVKHQESLLRAMAVLARKEPVLARRARVVIIGDGPLLTHLRSQAQALGVAGLTWFAGAVSNVPDLMRALDVFVLPSLLEGISNTILEAMATGLPVIATAVGGNLELVEEGETGSLFVPQNAEALADLFARYINDPSLRVAQGTRARGVAVQRFALDAMVQSYQTIYDDFCGVRAM